MQISILKGRRLGAQLVGSFLIMLLAPSAGAQMPAVEPETIYFAKVGENALRIGVISNGCTDSAHFRVDYEEHKLGPIATIYRDVLDHCRVVPMLVEISIPLPRAIGPDEALRIANPFGRSDRF